MILTDQLSPGQEGAGVPVVPPATSPAAGTQRVVEMLSPSHPPYNYSYQLDFPVPEEGPY